MNDPKSPSEIPNWMIQFAKDTIELYKPEWLERREIAKTLISLSSAALIFTITFSASIIKPDTPRFWRYAILVCWLTFISSLACSIGSLWFSMGLQSLPILIEQEAVATEKAFAIALQKRNRGENVDVDLVIEPFMKQFKRVAKEEERGLWLLRTSLCLFGVALLALSIVGIRQLLY